MKKGTTAIGGVFNGTTEIAKIMKNNVVVYENAQTLTAQGTPPLTFTHSLNKNALGYQVYGNSKQGNLPNGYTQLEYIATSSSDTVNAYIDTGLYANPNLRINTEVEFIAAKGQASIFRSGADFWAGVYLNSSLKFAYTYRDDAGNYTATSITAANGTRYNIDFDGKQKTLKINNNTITISGSPATKTSTKTLPLLGRIGGDGASVYSDFYGKLYYAKIYDNDILVRDFIPCKNSSNVIGMYDTVNDVFYRNAGTGNFVAGAEMPNVNNPLEIESVGTHTNNYFDTKKVSRYNYDVTIGDDSLTVVSGYQIIVNFKPYDLKPNTTYTLKYHLSRTQAVSNVQGRFRFAKDDGSTSIAVINNSDASSLELDLIGTFTTPSDIREYRKLWLYSGSSATTKFENIQLVEGTYTLQTMPDYESYGYKIPVTVNPNYELPKGYTQLDYIQSTGTQYIDTGVKPVNASYEITMSNPTATVTVGTYAAGVYSTPIIMLYFQTTSNIIRTNVNGVISDAIPLYNGLTTAKYDNTTGIFSYNGQQSQKEPQTFSSNDNFYLFAANNSGTPYHLERIQTLRIHSAKLWNNNILVRNMIPCKNSNNEVGMYDTVNKEFYPNAGTGNFVEGNILTTTTNIYLREPLRKLDDYTDYIDLETQKVYRNVAQQYYDGYSNSVTRETTRYTDYSRYTLSTFSPANAQTGASEELCNYCPQGTTPNKFYIGYNNAGFLYLADTLIGVTSEDAASDRIAKANNWLKTLIPVLYITYPRNTTSEESITLPDILLNKGTNIISIDTNINASNLWIKYKGKE